jgi:hypothetical protein
MAYNILELLIHETQPSNFISLRMMDLHQMPLQNYRHFRCSRVASKRHLHPTTMVLQSLSVALNLINIAQFLHRHFCLASRQTHKAQ